jgi:uncharacterized protein (DUF983 family)
MADGRHCPACGRDIGIWPVFSAGLPNRIWCPHCGARVRYDRAAGPVLALLPAAVVVSAVAFGVAFVVARRVTDHPLVWMGVFTAAFIAGMAGVELLVARFLRSRRQLAVTEPPPRRPGRVARSARCPENPSGAARPMTNDPL